MQVVFVSDVLAGIFSALVQKAGARIAVLLAQDASAPRPLSPSAADTPFADAVVDGLCSDLVHQAQLAREAAISARSGLSPETIDEFAYLLAAFTDEILIATLQERLPQRFNGAVERSQFGTMQAGEQIFSRIDRLIARNSDQDAAMAATYLLALSLGFKGQYVADDGQTIATYHRKLALIARAAPSAPTPLPGKHLAPVTVPWMPTPRQFMMLLGVITALWVLAAIGMEVAWRKQTLVLRTDIATLEAATSSQDKSTGHQR